MERRDEYHGKDSGVDGAQEQLSPSRLMYACLSGGNARRLPRRRGGREGLQGLRPRHRVGGRAQGRDRAPRQRLDHLVSPSAAPNLHLNLMT